MSKYIELHMLQTLPVNNINRGKYGEVKTTEYGGVVRQRVSSQSWKRPIRMTINEWCQLNNDAFGIFSRNHGSEIKTMLKRDGISIDNIDTILSDLGLGIKKVESDKKEMKKQTPTADDDEKPKDVIMSLSNDELNIIYNAIKNGSVYTKTKKGNVVTKELDSLLKDAGCRSAFDIALCGRMFASYPALNTNGAMRMNHPISTHAITRESDYFTAVDQLDPNGGFGHGGEFEFTTSTVYRYIQLDVDQLLVNIKQMNCDYYLRVFLKNCDDYLRVFLKTCILAFPNGKKNAMNANTRPSYIGFTVSNGFPHQLCGAFEKAVQPSEDGYLQPSIQRLKEYRTNDENSGFSDIIFSTEWEENRGMNINNIIESVINAIK